MTDPLLDEKIKELKNIREDELQTWYRLNKKVAQQIVHSLDHLELEKDRNGRVRFRQAAWHYRMNYHKKPTCSNCSNFVKWNDTSHSYQHFCSNACVHENGEHNQKRKDTNTQRYGVDNPFRNVEGIKQDRKKKLGVEHAKQNGDIIARIKNTVQQKYGVDHPWKNSSVRQKCVVTRKKNNKYSHLTNEQLTLLNDKDWLSEQLVALKKTQQQVAESIGVAQSTVGLYAAAYEIESQSRSKVQDQIHAFIKQNTQLEVRQNVRSVLPNNLELDIYIPEINTAVEVNGVFWHGELNGKHRKYHINKTELAREAGIRLVQVFDTEWYNHQDIVKSRLLSVLRINNRIYARKTKIVQLDSVQCRTFFSENHTQGFVGSFLAYGLTFNNELVAAMSFGKSRFSTEANFELLRYCSKNYTNVVGGASKLFNVFVTQMNPKTIVSYCDLRWGRGGLYHTLGFRCESEQTGPNYWYFKRNEVGQTKQLYSRMVFQKHKLSKLLPSFIVEHTEWENMINNGYDRIWDCGSSKWVWERETPSQISDQLERKLSTSC